MSKVVLIGGFQEVIELCQSSGYAIAGIIDGAYKGEFRGYPILGTDDEVLKILDQIIKYPLVITPDIPAIREKIFEYYHKFGFCFTSIISKEARVSQTATIGQGGIVQSGVNISSDVKIEDFVKLNTNCNIMHDCKIGRFTTIAPNAVVLGRVSIGTGSYIGANSTILPNMKIGDHAVIGAGAVVTKSVDSYCVVKGVPAR